MNNFKRAKPLFTVAQYREIGRQRAGIIDSITRVRSLANYADGINSVIFQEIVDCHESVFCFFNCFEQLAYQDFQGEDFTNDFWLANRADQRGLFDLSGLSVDENRIIGTAWQQRRDFFLTGTARVILTRDELKIIAKFLAFISKLTCRVCFQIIETEQSMAGNVRKKIFAADDVINKTLLAILKRTILLSSAPPEKMRWKNDRPR